MKRTILAVLAVTIMIAMPALAGNKINDTNVEPLRSDWPCNQQGDAGLCLPLDLTWEVVEFTNGVADCFENDDGSTVSVPLGFTFDDQLTPPKA